MSTLQGVENLNEKLVRLRRDFHRYPESGWLEYRTSATIADLLKEYGYDVYVGKDVCASSSRMGVPNDEVLESHEKRAIDEGVSSKWINSMKGGHTGVVGVIKSTKPGPTIALRFDIDSLNVHESRNTKHIPVQKGFQSLHEGMMHACGHDGHIAIGLGVAKLLMKNIDMISGEVRLIFQPAEEGCRGAKSIVDNGWLDGVNYFLGGHIAFQSFNIGEIVASVGGFLATTKFNVVYKGKSAHAGDKPENGKNALLAASSAALHLHGIARHSGGKTRVNVGVLEAGSGRNIIPELAKMEIETRGETNELNDYMAKEVEVIVNNIGKTYGVECNLEIVGKAQNAKSSEELISIVQSEVNVMKEINSLIPYTDLGASEDVVHMINEVQDKGGQASYFLYGSPIYAGHHNPLFDFDENVLGRSSKLLMHIVTHICNKNEVGC